MRTPLLPLVVLAGSALAGDPLVREAQQVDTNSLGVGLNPSIASGGDLVAVSFFDGGSSGTNGVSVVTSDGRGASWSAPVRVDADLTSANKIANFDACAVIGDSVYVVWKDERNGSSTDDVYFNRSTDRGATFPAANERLLDDGYSNLGTVRSWRSAASRADNGSDFIYVVMASDGPNANEELFLVFSDNGGATFSPALKVAGDGANWDIDSIAVAADGSTCHIAWDSDQSSPGSENDSTYYRRYDALTDTFGDVLPLDLGTDLPDLGDSQFGSNYSFDLVADGDLVALAWLEERGSTTNEELRVVYSIDGGESFGADERVGGYDIPGGNDVDFSQIAIVDGNLVVAYTDNRLSGGTLDDVYVSVNVDPVNLGGGWTEFGPLSGPEGGSGVRIAGGRTDVAVTYTSDASGNQYAGAATSTDGGLTWTTDIRLSDDTGTFDADIAELGYNALYQNFVHAFLSNATGNTNNVFVGGYRPQTLTPQGWVAGTTVASFDFDRFTPNTDNGFGVVLLSFSLADGQFPIPVGRDSGLAFDALTQFGLDFYTAVFTTIDASGSGSTPPLPLTAPAGVTFYAVGLGFTTGLGSSMRLTDPVRIDL